MKKIQFIFTVIFCVLILLAVNLFITQKQFNTFIGKDKTYFIMEYKEGLDFSKSIKEWQHFTKQNNVTLGSVSVNSETDYIFYQTGYSKELTHFIKKGRVATGKDEYISNVNRPSSNQVGELKIPKDLIHISIFPLEQIKNNGFSPVVFVEANSKMLPLATAFLEKYGNVKKMDSPPFMNVTTQFVAIFTFLGILFLIYTFFLFFKVERQSKKIGIFQLLGKTKNEFLWSDFRSHIFSFLLAIGVSFAGVFIYQSLNKGHLFLSSLCYAFFISIVWFMLLTFIYNLFLYVKFKQDKQLIFHVKGKQLLKTVHFLNYLFLSGFVFSIFFITGISIQKITELRTEQKAVNIWKKTKKTYRLAYTDNLKKDDLKESYETNKKIVALYKEIIKKKQGFMMESSNFRTFPGENKFTFEENINTEKDLYGLYGYTVLISPNYLSVNPIKKYGNLPPFKENELTILVPENLKPKEKMIKAVMLDDFYEVKVAAKNETLEALKLEKIKTKREDLKINLIYVEKGQKYFTYSTDQGLAKNHYQIINPIAVIINPTIDKLFLAGYMTHAMFIEDSSNTEAYTHLQPLLKKTGTTSNVIFLDSVYKELGEKINKIQLSLYIYVALFFSAITFLVILILVQMYMYYQMNYKKIQVQNLLGTSWFNIYFKFILLVMTIILVSGAFFSYFFKTIILLSLSILLILFIGLVIWIYTNYLLRRTLKNSKQGGE